MFPVKFSSESLELIQCRRAAVIYSKHLPSIVEVNAASYGLKRDKDEDDQSISAILKDKIPSKQIKNEVESLKYKIQHLDTTKNKLKKKCICKRKRITAKQRKHLKLFDILPEEQRYEAYLPLNKLWIEYMRKLIDFDRLNLEMSSQWETKFLKADYHGLILTVIRSKCPHLVGQTGILVQETKNTLKIITKDDVMKTIPKGNCVFTFTLEGYVFTIHGKHFQHRASDRANRKYKAKKTLDL